MYWTWQSIKDGCIFSFSLDFLISVSFSVQEEGTEMPKDKEYEEFHSKNSMAPFSRENVNLKRKISKSLSN